MTKPITEEKTEKEFLKNISDGTAGVIANSFRDYNRTGSEAQAIFYFRLWKTLPKLDDIFESPETASIPTVGTGMSHERFLLRIFMRADTDSKFAAAQKYANRLRDSSVGCFMELIDSIIHRDEKKKPATKKRRS